jgi:hypothetical protein
MTDKEIDSLSRKELYPACHHHDAWFLLGLMRFNYSLERRSGGTNWRGAYRFRLLPNKQERQEYRLTAYGDSPDDAIRRGYLKLINRD